MVHFPKFVMKFINLKKLLAGVIFATFNKYDEVLLNILVCAAGYTFEGTGCRACPADTFKSEAGNNITCTRCTAHSTTRERRAQTSDTCGMCGFH